MSEKFSNQRYESERVFDPTGSANIEALERYLEESVEPQVQKLMRDARGRHKHMDENDWAAYEAVVRDKVRDAQIARFSRGEALRKKTSSLEIKLGIVLGLFASVVVSHMLGIDKEVYESFFTDREEKIFIDTLRQEVPDREIDAILYQKDAFDDDKERQERLARKLEAIVDGFEKFPVHNKEIFSTLKTLPESVQKNISELKYEDKMHYVSDEYNIKEADGKPAPEAAHAARELRAIVVTKGAEGEQKFWIINDLIEHEAGHLSDWISNKYLTVKEKLTLLKRVIARLDAPDRYRSSYVEKINNLDPRIQTRDKATEYFAEIMAQYLGEGYAGLSTADKNIVEYVLLRTDPKFDRAQSLASRTKIAGVHKVNKKPIKDTEVMPRVVIVEAVPNLN